MSGVALALVLMCLAYGGTMLHNWCNRQHPDLKKPGEQKRPRITTTNLRRQGFTFVDADDIPIGPMTREETEVMDDEEEVPF